MKSNVEVRKTININAELAWDTIRRSDGLETWFPAITSCRLDGDKRFCTLAGGGDVVETILEIDNRSRIFRYSVDEHPLPVGPVQTSIQIIERGSNCEVIWRANFEGSDEGVKMVAPMLEGLYAQGIDALASHHQLVN